MLTPKYKKVYPNVNLASHRFYQDWEKWWGESPPVAQPQIDLILVPSNLRLHAKNLYFADNISTVTQFESKSAN